MLTACEALKLIEAGLVGAEEDGVPLSFAVMDPHGHLLALIRMNEAPWISADIAQGKAWTAAAYGVHSGAQKEKMTGMPSFSAAISTMSAGRFTPQTGAVPIYRDGLLIGAMGASGGTGEQDEAACTRAAELAGYRTSR